MNPEMDVPHAPAAGRRRRAEPITKRTSRSGTVTYEFRADVGTKPDGSRDRRRFTYRTLAEAKRASRRITSEVASGASTQRSAIIVEAACDEWLAGRRGIRRVTLQGSIHTTSKRYAAISAGKKLQQLTKADGDALVEWMLTKGRTSPKRFRPDSVAAHVIELIAQHPTGITAAELASAFPGRDVHTCIAGLFRAKRIRRVHRGVYIVNESDDAAARGVKPVTVRSTLTTLGVLLQSFVDQGVLPRNVIALVERPADGIIGDESVTAKSWTLAEVEQFRAAIRDERLLACWQLSCYGLRRSEVPATRWSALDDDTLSIRRSRVSLGKVTEEGLPKSRRSRRDLPLPAELATALQELKARQQAEAHARGTRWSDDLLVAVHEDGSPIRPQWYSDEFQRLRQRAGLRRLHLKGLRNTSVSLMLAGGCRYTSSRPGMAMTRRCRCRSTRTPSVMI